MGPAVAPVPIMGRAEALVAGGDLAQLSEGERLEVYRRTCETLGLNPATRPLEYLRMQGRMVLYVRKEATDQLRRIHGVSIRISEMGLQGELYVVRIEARMGGRMDEDMGVVAAGALKGDALAIAIMRAVSKAKRRVTLSIVGLGWAGGEDGAHVEEAEMPEGAEDEQSGAHVAPAAGIALLDGAVDGDDPADGRRKMEASTRRWREVTADLGGSVDDLRHELTRLRLAGALTVADIEDAIAEAMARGERP